MEKTKWIMFCEKIKKKNRFFIDEEYYRLFKSIIENLIKEIEKNAIFYRARINNFRVRDPYPLDKMSIPPIEKTMSGGRVNPPGISYLYLSDSPKVCISELTPTKRDYITVAKVRLKRKIKIIDFNNFFVGNSEEEVDIGLQMFYYLSSPINNRQKEIEYLPMQYLAEFIKVQGYDGIMHISSRVNGEGSNLVIFDSSIVEFIDREVYRITGVNYNFVKDQ